MDASSNRPGTDEIASEGSIGDATGAGTASGLSDIVTIGSEAGEAGGGEGGGDSALDEVLFPWFVVGVNRDGAKQARWLTSRHSLFV